MHRFRYGKLALVLAFALFGSGCDDDEPTALPPGPFDLMFSGDATFQGAHAGDAISVAVVRVSDGQVVARQSGTVSGTADPSFSFTFPNLLERGTAYEVHYWIDSNFGGGSVGACDPPATDHQWNVAVAAPTTDVTVTEAHNPGAITDVCATFSTADLSFSGDATFNGPHGGQAIRVAVVRASDGEVVARQSGTVSTTADPAFEFSFPGVLVLGVAYEVDYWIDSNFGGGIEGVCGPPADDHQWRVDIPAVAADVAVDETHNPGAIRDVCDSFTADLTFEGDATFQGPHAGDAISVSVVRASDGAVMARQSGVVSGTQDPSFSFEFRGLLVIDVAYEVHYWIDSNFGGGSLGTCDPPANDHQWNVALMTVTDDVAFTDTHRPGETMDVCGSFPSASLTFEGDATFQGPHGGQSISVAVVRSTDGAVVDTQSGIVSAIDDPSFSFTFTGALIVGAPYEVHYWIDSNFGGGTIGTCDPPTNDHQWNNPLMTVTGDVDFTDTHRPGETEDVCATFQ